MVYSHNTAENYGHRGFYNIEHWWLRLVNNPAAHQHYLKAQADVASACVYDLSW